MSNGLSRIRLTLRAVAIVAIGTCVPDRGAAFAAGSSVPYPKTAFQRLLARGERPEIVSCIVAGTDALRGDARWADVRFDDDVSKTARVRDEEIDGRFVRRVELHGTARSRDGAAARRPVRVSCEQVEAQPIHIVVQAE